MDIFNIFLLYDGDGSPESPSSVPVVGFVEALVTVVVSVKPVVLVLAGPSVGGIKQLQINNNNKMETLFVYNNNGNNNNNNNNNNTKEEVVQKLNKPDTNCAGVMAPVTQQPCIVIKFHSSR